MATAEAVKEPDVKTTEFKSADEILSVSDLELREYEIPEWKTKIYFRVLSAADFFDFQEKMQQTGSAARKHALVRLFMLCAVDKSGNRLFADNQKDALMKKSIKVFLKVEDFLLELSGMKPDAQKKLVEQAKNDSSEEPHAA